MKKVSVLVMAAGRSTRMQGTDKLLLAMGASSVIEQSLAPFLAHDQVEQVIVVTDSLQVTERLKQYSKIKSIVGGGPERQDSVMNGLAVLSDQGYVLIHDGARPFLSAELLERALEMAAEGKCFTLAVPVTDTIKRVEGSLVLETPSRAQLYAAQTPQGFPVEKLRRAYEFVKEKKLIVTDDAQALELIGEKVYIVRGDYANRKITTKEDLIYL